MRFTWSESGYQVLVQGGPIRVRGLLLVPIDLDVDLEVAPLWEVHAKLIGVDP